MVKPVIWNKYRSNKSFINFFESNEKPASFFSVAFFVTVLSAISIGVAIGFETRFIVHSLTLGTVSLIVSFYISRRLKKSFKKKYEKENTFNNDEYDDSHESPGGAYGANINNVASWSNMD